MPKAKSQPNYGQLKAELEDILSELQDEELDVEKALKSYKRGLEITKQLETYLKTAENEVLELKAKFDSRK